jgi:hypothetical protein
MYQSKFVLRFLLALAIVFAQAGAVYAAPPQQGDTTNIRGTILTAVVEPDADSVLPTVMITLWVNGEEQSIRVNLDTAKELGLILLDENGDPVLENGLPVIDDAMFGSEVDIMLDDIVTDEPQHPVASKITEFFSNLIGVNYGLVMGSHTDGGFGFGVITQALWITQTLGGDATLFQDLLYAKEHNDYSRIVLPGEMQAQSWGQLRKIISTSVDSDTVNLGDIMSGGDHEQGIGNGKPENPGSGKPENPGNGNRPETPPGQEKDKDKDKDNNGKGNTK